ncbi:hypothetical protein E2R56_07660 [Rhodococcus qingshengii]|nr:hypothetical protein E2R56_07660 [Rhodococcus qingshengii]
MIKLIGTIHFVFIDRLNDLYRHFACGPETFDSLNKNRKIKLGQPKGSFGYVSIVGVTYVFQI